MSTKGTDATPNGPLDDLVDKAIFAPLGLALEYRRLAPELAETGRKQVQFARTLGKAALKTMTAAASAGTGEPAKKAPASTARPAKKSPSKAGAGTKSVVEGYDAMTAKEIIAFAADASSGEIAWMLEQEQAGKQRKTVLARLTRPRD